MREFTLQNWQEALSKVYASAAIDRAYRELCLTNPREAVQRVSDIQLPASFRFEFVARAEDIRSSLLLPPLLGPIAPDHREQALREAKEFTDWYVTGYPYGSPMEMHTIGGGGTHGGSGLSAGSGSGSGEGDGGDDIS